MKKNEIRALIKEAVELLRWNSYNNGVQHKSTRKFNEKRINEIKKLIGVKKLGEVCSLNVDVTIKEFKGKAVG